MSSIGPAARRITLLTDFGTRDGYTGAMRGVISSIAPEALLEDIAHDIPRGDVHAAAWCLATYAALYPPGTIHVAVVDPGVGSGRRALAARTGSHIFVAPDNGLLTRVLENDSEVVEIRAPAFRRSTVSATFHGRDVFAPAAAHIARGIALDQLGPRALGIVRLPQPTPVRDEQQITGEIVHIDHFGNLITNVPGAWLTTGNPEDAQFDIELAGRVARLTRTYADVEQGELLAYIGSGETVEAGLRDGNAAATLKMERGATVTIRRAAP